MTHPTRLPPRYGRLRSWAHHRGIARLVNSTYEQGRHTRALVETALPSRLLARYAGHDPLVRLHHARIISHQHLGLLRRRWELRP